ncbi:transmembrane protease serine 11E-like [Platysternon megacephalum]|uniref:RING-type E3 ubiquitin transferase n=1 Tax=Platysternon megacephalum TaxID=55544 RepID=A0A4D9E4A8_9SAUR|nr:transmembrane protease serine 11E-like [Platysternon megacephalum]
MEDSFPPEEIRSGQRHFRLSKTSMRSEEKRLRTFRQWPESSPVSATDLAKAGFFFLGPGDRVQCFCCGGILRSWEAEDQPMREHHKFFPTCKFIRGEDVGNQQMLPFLEILDYVDGQILSLLQRMDVEEAALPSQPEYPEMETEAMRLATFQSWPPYTELYPEQLARAGFFYTGRRGKTKALSVNVDTHQFVPVQCNGQKIFPLIITIYREANSCLRLIRV